jgi:hypothetical protein
MEPQQARKAAETAKSGQIGPKRPISFIFRNRRPARTMCQFLEIVVLGLVRRLLGEPWGPEGRRWRLGRVIWTKASRWCTRLLATAWESATSASRKGP